jgi:hypothetical protein
MSTPNIDLSQMRWQDASIDNERPRSRLLAAVQFNGILHHLEAIEVKWDERTSTQSAACSVCEPTLSAYGEAAGGDGPFRTVTIEARPYAIFVTPYCR